MVSSVRRGCLQILRQASVVAVLIKAIPGCGVLIRNCSEKVGEERIFMLLGEQTETARDVTSVIFDFERAQLETSSLHGEWGADDFGENPPLGEYGRELAARIREEIISRSASSPGFSR